MSRYRKIKTQNFNTYAFLFIFLKKKEKNTIKKNLSISISSILKKTNFIYSYNNFYNMNNKTFASYILQNQLVTLKNNFILLGFVSRCCSFTIFIAISRMFLFFYFFSTPTKYTHTQTLCLYKILCSRELNIIINAPSIHSKQFFTGIS